MSRKTSRLLVIDADVAQAASGHSEQPDSLHCREFLQQVFKICHRVVVSKEILEEWQNHSTPFFRQWLNLMENKGKRKDDERIKPDHSLRKKIEGLDLGQKAETAVIKDMRLIEAALAADCVIVSKNDRERKKFKAIADKVQEIGRITWVNPANPKEDPIAWLKAGAKNEPGRRLKAK